MRISRRLLVSAVLATMLVGSAAGPARADEPPVFSKMTLEEGKATSKKDGKIFVVKATAEWCGPCKMMNRTTMRDARVEGWFKDNGTIIEFDVDKQPELARSLKVRAMPTMIAFKNGEEFDRIVGFREADALAAWLDGVERGERATDALIKKADQAGRGETKMSMRERMDLARSLAQAGKDERATEEYAWLWENIVKEEPETTGVRGSLLAGEMEQLAAGYAPAKERFARFRDEAEARLKGEDKSWSNLDDWIVLNGVVGDQDRTLAWFDRVKNDAGSGKTLEREWFRLERLLEGRERWADVARLTRNPLAKVREANAQTRMMIRSAASGEDKQQADKGKATARRMFRDTTSQLYAGLLAAGREADAVRVAAEAVKLDDTGAMRRTLVERALRAGRVRADHMGMLQDAKRSGEPVDELLREVEAAVGNG